MIFTPAEAAYLRSQPLGRLATQQPRGVLQVSPVGFTYNADLETIDIFGYAMSTSQKYRNAAHNGRVAFVVDDVPSVDPWQARFLEIRGVAEAVPSTEPEPGVRDGAFIRIRPKKIISFGIEELDVPMKTRSYSRKVD